METETNLLDDYEMNQLEAESDVELDDDEENLFDAEDEDTDDDFESKAVKQDNLISDNDINLQIKCEVGQVSISLAKLVKYRIGDTLEMAKWPGKVKLTANGTYFAEGVLVDVAGMLGVKITNKISYN
ncbi:MAG: hypothetical protein QG673_1617 [Pseudomonadota bacterium]|nr:hypothetical protein [Pseudomonadota bacterium]